MDKSSQKPRIFIASASSLKGMEVARAIQSHLSKQKVDARVWDEHGVIVPGATLISRLVELVNDFTHAIIVLTPEDIVKSRGSEGFGPRDNLLVEAGMFLARRGLESVYFVRPESVDLKLPSDFAGILFCPYNDDGSPPNLGPAVSDIVAAVRKSSGRTVGAEFEVTTSPDPFWDVLGNEVIIVFGVEDDQHLKQHGWMSLHDLEGAAHIYSFLARKYPHKKIYFCPSSSRWEGLLKGRADLVVVGGFVTNAEFDELYVQFQHRLRLKMGRLCSTEGQDVYHVAFRGQSPPREDFVAIEALSSSQVERDFAAVTNISLDLYQHERRLITIAGVKGNGTRGGAIHLTQGDATLSSLLTEPLTQTDILELIVSSDVRKDLIRSTRLMEVIRNGDRLYRAETAAPEPCELGRPCVDCYFGILTSVVPEPAKFLGVHSLVFDLDDTLVDTFTQLIIHLESDAVAKICAAHLTEMYPASLLEILLNLRRTHPDRLEKELQKRVPTIESAALDLRRKVVEETSTGLDSLSLSPNVKALLVDLRSKYRLYMVTSGDPAYQRRKIEHLGLTAGIFEEIKIVDKAAGDEKLGSLRDMVKKHGRTPGGYVVIGNRLDEEIQAARALGMKTVWVKTGEGSEMLSDVPVASIADTVVTNLADIRRLFLLSSV